MYQDEFARRLLDLRTAKGVSARDMSLSIGQNAGYINTIESGKALPSMTAFFYICEYLHISPKEFFDAELRYPQKMEALINDLKKLNDTELDSIAVLAKALQKNNTRC